MEVKKVSVKRQKSFFVYIQELKDELGRVSWTDKNELAFSTKLVVLATFLFGLGIYFVDFAVKGGLDLLRFVLHRIFG